MTYPTDGQYALMAKLVYLDEEAQLQPQPFTTKGATHADALDMHHAAWAAQGWVRWAHELGFYQDDKTGYVGSVYVNHQTRQVVVAHRGTVPSVWGSLKEDYQAILMCRLGAQQQVAFDYYRKVLTLFRGEGEANVIDNKQLSHYQLSFTGHSLGAWLAEVCAADCLLQLDMIAHVVSFESPGSRAMTVAMAHDNPVQVARLLKVLDIISYLAAPNLVNVCNPHVGTLRRLKTAFPPMNKLEEWFTYTLNMHGMSELLLSFNAATGLPLPLKCESARDWPYYNFVEHASKEYKVFHQLVSQATEYSLEGGQNYDECFQLTYGAHYQPSMFQNDHIDTRHLHPLVRDFILGYQGVSATLSAKLAGIDAGFGPLLNRYKLTAQDGAMLLVIQTPEGGTKMSAMAWSQALMALLAKYPQAFTELKTSLDLDTRVGVLEQTRERLPALMTLVEYGAVLDNVLIENYNAAFARIGSGATSEQLAMVERAWQALPEERRRIVGIEAGARVSNSQFRNIHQVFFDFGTPGASSSNSTTPAPEPSSSSGYQTPGASRS